MPQAHAAASARAVATFSENGLTGTRSNGATVDVAGGKWTSFHVPHKDGFTHGLLNMLQLVGSDTFKFNGTTGPSVQYRRSEPVVDGLISSAAMQCDLVRHGTFKGQLGRATMRSIIPVEDTLRSSPGRS